MLRRMACFGSPKYDRHEALHILSADSRFPDLSPGKQVESGNHFLAMFPEEKKGKQKRLRGGDGGGDVVRPHPAHVNLEMKEVETDDAEAAEPRRRWWSKILKRHHGT